MISNYPLLGFMLTVLLLLQVLLLASVAGRRLDTRAIKDRRGQSQATRERNTSFYHSVVLIGIISIAAGYAMSLAASWTLESTGVITDGEPNPGILAAGGVIIVFEILLIIVARSHEREILLDPADVRFELAQLTRQGDLHDGARLDQLKGQLERIKADNIALRTQKGLSARFDRRYEKLFQYDERQGSDGHELIYVKRTKLSLRLWCKYLFFSHGLMLGRLRGLVAIGLVTFLSAVIIVNACIAPLVTSQYSPVVVFLVFLVFLTYLVDSKNSLLQIAKSQVLLRAQIAACDRLIAALQIPSAGCEYALMQKFGKWEILRRR